MSHHTDFSPQNFQGQQKHRQPDRVLILNLSSVLSKKVTLAAMGSPKSEVRNHQLDEGIFPKTQVSHLGKKGRRRVKPCPESRGETRVPRVGYSPGRRGAG